MVRMLVVSCQIDGTLSIKHNSSCDFTAYSSSKKNLKFLKNNKKMQNASLS